MDRTELEQIILGCCLIDYNYKVLDECLSMITPLTFKEIKNQKIFTAMINNRHKNIENTVRSVKSVLERMGHSNTIDYLLHLQTISPSNENVTAFLNDLVDISNKEILINVASKISTDKSLTSGEMSTLLKEEIDKLQLIDNTVTYDIEDISVPYAKKLIDGKIHEECYPTLFNKLDDMLRIVPSNLILIGARPSVGKSAFALNMADNFARQDNKVFIVTMEMSKEENLNRLYSMRTRIDYQKINTSNLESKEKLQIEKVAKEFKNITFDDRGTVDVDELAVICAKKHRKGLLDILIIDHIGLLSTRQRTNSRNNEVGYISRRLKQLAMDLKIPVIALSQLNRATETSEEPDLTSLRDSGSLEQDANVVMFLFRISQDDFEENFITLKLSKNRSGKVGKIPFIFRGKHMLMRESKKNEQGDWEIDDISKGNNFEF